MKILGIIFEANPFHYGHKYLIDEAKSQINPDLTIAVTSGYFTMRGEVSIMSKQNKTKVLLENGIDLVLDLPIVNTLNSADYFAESCINILLNAGITDLAFGIEDASLNELYKILEIEALPSFDEAMKFNKVIYKSYKKAYEKTIFDLSADTNLARLASLPNITLGLAYLRALKNHQEITVHTINRIGEDDNSLELSNKPSGTAIRNAYYNKEDITSFIPYNIDKLTDITSVNEHLSLLLKLLTTKPKESFKDIQGVSEGIENYILSNINILKSFDENIENLANKNYTKSRIRRTILSMMLEIPNNLQQNNKEIRVLGFSEQGIAYLGQLKGKCDIINNVKNPNELISYDLKAVQLYSLITNKDYIMDEYKFPIKNKE